jgi:hypothetical protein
MMGGYGVTWAFLMCPWRDLHSLPPSHRLVMARSLISKLAVNWDASESIPAGHTIPRTKAKLGVSQVNTSEVITIEPYSHQPKACMGCRSKPNGRGNPLLYSELRPHS